MKRPKALRSASGSIAIGVACLLGSTSIAMAGFEWKTQPAPTPAPVQTAAPLVGSTIVNGSGDNQPLGLVLHQIVPPDLTYNAAPGVDQGTRVSWRGGRPWWTALEDALQPVGYALDINGSVVTISTTAPAYAPPQPMMQQPVYVAPTPIAPVMSAPASMPEPVMAPPASPLDQTMSWDAARGTTLRALLESWCERAQVELYYSAEYDYPLEASIHVDGTFEDAVRALLGGFEHATPQPIGKLHRNNAAGHAVLVVETRGNAYGD